MNASAPPGVLLLAEDSDSDVHFFMRAVELSGEQLPVAVVTDGEQAINYISGRAPYGDRTRHAEASVMLLDLKMPRKSGLEVLAWMKAEGVKSPKVIVWTSSEETSDIRRAYDLGAVAYIVKPVSLAILQKIVKALARFWRNPGEGSEAALSWYIRPLS